MSYTGLGLVLYKRQKRTQKYRGKKGNVNIETKIGVTRLPAKECQELSANHRSQAGGMDQILI